MNENFLMKDICYTFADDFFYVWLADQDLSLEWQAWCGCPLQGETK